MRRPLLCTVLLAVSIACQTVESEPATSVLLAVRSDGLIELVGRTLQPESLERELEKLGVTAAAQVRVAASPDAPFALVQRVITAVGDSGAQFAGVELLEE